MLDKGMYDSWKIRMELYMQNREHGRMILESVEHGPLIWPTIDENGVTRTKKYAKLSTTGKIQADCDMKAINIILQGLPTNIYSLVNHHRVAKDPWKNVQLLIQGTSLTKQERECKLLPPKWSKFVKDLHTTNFDQLHAYLEQHELNANEVRLMRERSQGPLALVASHRMTPSHFNTYQSSYNNPQFQQQFSPSQSPQYGSIHPTQHYSTTYPSIPLAITYPSTPYPNAYSSIIYQDACPQQQSIPQMEYTVSIVNQQTHLTEFPQIDYGLAFPVFKQGDDPIDAINKMMSFLSTVVTSRFPSTNNQLRNSSNPRKQATIHDGKVTVQPLQGRQILMLLEELEFLANPDVAEGPVTQSAIIHNAAYQADDLDVYDSDCDEISTAKEVLMANLSKNEIHSDSNIIPYSRYLVETQNAAVQDTNSSTQQDAMILSVFEQLLQQVTNYNKVNKDNLIANESLSAKLERYKEWVKLLEERQNVDLGTKEKLIIDDIIRDKDTQFADFEKEINSLKLTLFEQLKEKETLTKTFNVLKNEFKKKEAKNIDKEIALEKKFKELDNIVYKMGQSAQTVHMLTKPQETNVISIDDSEETLMLEEESRSKMLLKQSDPMVLEKKVNIKLVNYVVLNQLSEDFGKCFVPQQELSAEQAFWFPMSNPSIESSDALLVKVDVPSELPKVSLVNASFKKLKFHLAQFNSMVKKRTTPDALTE
ncbi:hypothetical protein Tco_0561495, partial [Tanacetum coccineum]